MANRTDREGIVIDVDSKPATSPRPAQTADGHQPAHAERSGGRLGIVLSLFALILTAAGLFVGYNHWSALLLEMSAMESRLSDGLQTQQRLAEAVDRAKGIVQDQQQLLTEQRTRLDASLAEHLSDLDRQRRKLQQSDQRLQDERLRVEERELQLRAAVTDVNLRLGRSGNEWMVAEAKYLIRLADHRLKLARDPDTAKAALTLADQRLKDTLDPGWTDVREKLARNLADLAALKLPDVDELAARLGMFSMQLDALPLAGEHPTAIPAAVESPDVETERTWQTLWRDFQSGLKNSIRIRRIDRPTQVLLAPEHALYVRQYIKLHLEAARLGLLRADVRLYQDSLAAAQQRITDTFHVEHSATQALQTALQDLSAIDVRPTLPDIGVSLHSLKVRERLMNDIADQADANEDTPLTTDSAQ